MRGKIEDHFDKVPTYLHTYLPNSSVDYMAVTSLEPRLASAVGELWQDKGMQEAYSRRNEFYISDSAGFFMSNVARFVDRDYLPTQARGDVCSRVSHLL